MSSSSQIKGLHFLSSDLIDGLYSLYLESIKTGKERDPAIDRMYSIYCKAKGTQIRTLKGFRQTKLEEFGFTRIGIISP